MPERNQQYETTLRQIRSDVRRTVGAFRAVPPRFFLRAVEDEEVKILANGAAVITRTVLETKTVAQSELDDELVTPCARRAWLGDS